MKKIICMLMAVALVLSLSMAVSADRPVSGVYGDLDGAIAKQIDELLKKGIDPATVLNLHIQQGAVEGGQTDKNATWNGGIEPDEDESDGPDCIFRRT